MMFFVTLKQKIEKVENKLSSVHSQLFSVHNEDFPNWIQYELRTVFKKK